MGGRGEVKRFITVKTDNNRLNVITCMYVYIYSIPVKIPTAVIRTLWTESALLLRGNISWRFTLKTFSSIQSDLQKTLELLLDTSQKRLYGIFLIFFITHSALQPFIPHFRQCSLNNRPSDFHKPTSPLEKIINPFKTTLLETVPPNQSFKMFDIHLAQIISFTLQVGSEFCWKTVKKIMATCTCNCHIYQPTQSTST